MRFTWFNLMPWPHLPEDFRQRHRSVWVDIPNRLYDPREGHRVYHEYMDQLEYADALGFDGIGVNEHHQNAYGLMPSPNLIASALARRTSRAAICVIGNSIALYNPPIRVAEEFAMLDVISGGRLVAGFPVGTPMDTNFCYGQIPALTRDKYDEAHRLIVRAWTEEEPFAFDGKYNQLRYVNCWPRPIQQPHPPVYVPGGGSIETWDFCLDHDYNYSYLSFGGYKAGKALLDGYWERVAARGKDESPHRAAFAQIICVADTDAEAEQLYAEHVLYFFNRCLHVAPGFSDPPGYRTLETIRAGKLNQLRAEAQKVFQSLTWKDLVEGGFVIAGSPATVRERMEEMIKGLRIGHCFCLFHNGDMPDWKTRHSSKLFAEKVMPELRGLWPDWEEDDRFWIRPMEDRLRPEERLPAAGSGR
ncbi:MAG: LLM class flavin-dependent oxidoreductase [Myxococcota bacterium]|nr:LLM class flavin-dependent oxidoreductase [Myxococcota bacterium]